MTTYRKLQVHTISPDFRGATRIVTATVPETLPRGKVLVENYWVAINASDVNYSNGKYRPGVKPPFDIGFESIGKVLRVADDVTKFKPGDAVAAMGYGCFSEKMVSPQGTLHKIPFLSPQVLPIMLSGVTAAVGLTEVGQIKSGQTVLVTAAAGGTGQFAVQLAKLAGCHVIGTCSSDTKAEWLKSIGCDRPINYKKEDFNAVLKKEYPKGVDVVYESVGGSMFDVCVNNLAIKGKIIIIGMISGYQDGSAWTGGNKGVTSVWGKILAKSQSINGFFLPQYPEATQREMKRLVQLTTTGKIQSGIDNSNFFGLEQIADAVDYMYEGKNIGKLVVKMKDDSKL